MNDSYRRKLRDLTRELRDLRASNAELRHSVQRLASNLVAEVMNTAKLRVSAAALVGEVMRGDGSECEFDKALVYAQLLKEILEQ